jgi:hypothetical protein
LRFLPDSCHTHDWIRPDAQVGVSVSPSASLPY